MNTDTDRGLFIYMAEGGWGVLKGSEAIAEPADYGHVVYGFGSRANFQQPFADRQDRQLRQDTRA